MTRVLVIDDDIGTAELMRVVLGDAGFDVTVAMTTRDIPTQKFDCIVSDLMSVQVYTYEDARDWHAHPGTLSAGAGLPWTRIAGPAELGVIPGASSAPAMMLFVPESF